MSRKTRWKKCRAERKLKAQQQRSIRLTIEELETRVVPSATGFRPVDEVGNNGVNPAWGTAGIDLVRLSPAAYADGISTPSLPGSGATITSPAVAIPSPRTISNDVFNQSPTLFGSPSTDINTVDGNGLSDFGYSFGQFMDHDMDLTPDQTGFPVPSPNPTKDGDDGFPIPADKTNGTDPIGSLAFSRSVYDTTTGTSTSNPRQQTTSVTAYLDLSQVYGSSTAVEMALRTGTGGMLKTSPGNMLPYYNSTYFSPTAFDPDPNQLAELEMQNNGPLPDDELFAAGDVRANENTELTALTTLFVRNHNAIAAELAQQDPTQYGFTSWTDENLYQEARKLNIAEYQNIIYTQYLPALLGPDAPTYTGYDSTINPSISTEFSTVAFRFGHSMLNNTVARDANNGSSVGALPLEEDFFDANLVNPNGIIDPTTGLVSTDIGAYLKGDADNSAQAVDTMAVSSIRDELFGNGVPGGEDLISRDIWRARDNGIGNYNQVRVALGLPAITDDATHGFDQITSNVQVQQELETAYASTIASGGFAGDIDPFVGGLAEDHLPGSDMGPLFTTILTDQFSNLENGDQYFYRNESFTPAEQAILNQGSSLAQIITTNTGVTNLQANVFYAQPVTAVGSTLYLVGGSTSNDTVQINPVGSSNTGSTGVKVVATLDGVHSTTPFNHSFTAISFFGGSGNDNIQVANTLTIPVTINAGNGNDNVHLGNGPSTVTLGSGNDNIFGGNSNSTVSAGDGNDSVILGNGDNNVTLGNGNDNVQLGNGNNVIVTGNGNDNIMAGDGDNLIVAGLGQHNVMVGNGSNILIDGSATLTNSGDSLRQVLDDWMTFGAADIANIRSRLSITFNTLHANNLMTGRGLDWFFYTDAQDHTNRKATDVLN